MEDYREMYYTMVRASENAINILVDAQRKCEEMYLSAAEGEIPQAAEPAEDVQYEKTGTSDV